MLETLTSYIANQILNGPRGEALGPDDDLLGSEILDSLGVMQVIQFLEMEYDVRVPPEDVTIENFMTINTMVAYLEQRLAPS